MFKLSSAELKKMFMRPAVYVMLFVLTLVLVLSTMLYNPTPRINPTTNFGGANSTISMAFTDFDSPSNLDPDSKIVLDNNLDFAQEKIENYKEHANFKNLLSEKLSGINEHWTKSEEGYLNYDYNELFKLHHAENVGKVVDDLIDLKQLAEKLYQLCPEEIDPSIIGFYITTADFDTIKTYALNLLEVIPSVDKLNNIRYIPTAGETWEDLRVLCEEVVLPNLQPTTPLTLLNNTQDIEISDETIAEIVDKYYEKVAYKETGNSVLTTIYSNIKQFATQHSTETSDEVKKQFNELTTQYKIAAILATNLLNDVFYLEKTANLSDATIQHYIGFEKFNRYSATENVTLQNYLLDNKIFDGKYLTNFNFNTSSGYENSAYDFAVYAMQILSIVLTMFGLFFAVTILAGDLQNGSMKMIATRPLTRAQIVGGKTLATIRFTFIFALFCMIASFVVGFAMFGLGSGGSVITVFNATSVLVMPAWAMLLIYFASLMLNIIFYIVLANLFSVIFRSSILSMFLTFVVFAGGLLLNALFVSVPWFMFTPYAFLDLFRYFGGASATGGFLTFGATALQNFWGVFAVILGLVVLLDIITKWIFQKRDIT